MGWFGLGSVVVELGSLVWWVSVSVSGGCCVVVGSGGGGRGAKPRVGGCALCWVVLGSVVVGLGSLVWWASVSVSGECCVVVGGGGGGRGAKPRVGGCALGVGRCVFRGLGQDFAKMVHFRPSENLENNFRQHVVLLEYLPTRYCLKFLRPFVRGTPTTCSEGLLLRVGALPCAPTYNRGVVQYVVFDRLGLAYPHECSSKVAIYHANSSATSSNNLYQGRNCCTTHASKATYRYFVGTRPRLPRRVTLE